MNIPKMDFKTKLALMLTLPLLGLLFFSTIGVVDKYRTMKSMCELEARVNLTEKSGNVIHELQIERAVSALFLGSKGTKFSSQFITVAA